jgi:tetratricopeptide (TPR) repeat protein
MSLLEHFDPYRIVSVSANNNLFAGLLLISMPLALAGYAMFQGFMKYVSVAVATLALFFIVILQSRAVYLGLCCAGLVFIILLAVRFRVLITRKNILVAGIFLMLLSLGIGIFYASLDQTRKYYFLSKVPVWQYFQSYDAGMKDLLEKKRKEKAALNGMPAFDFAESYYENANLRVIFWKKSAGLFAAHPLKGVGAGNWRINVPSCPKPDNPDHTFKNYTYSQPHNEWIGIITELGVPGFLLMVIVFFVPVIILYYKLLVQKLVMPFSVAVYLSFITGFYLYACFDFPFHRIEHNVIFFAVMALMTGKSCLPENSGAYHVKPWRYLRFILVGGLIFTTMVIVLRIRGEFFTRLMFRYEGRDQEKVIFYGRQAGSCCYRLTPNTLPLDWFIGVAEYRLRQPAKALQSFQKALLVTPYEVRVLNDRATALYSLGKVDQARAVLKKTLAIDPFFDDARFNLAAMLYFAGKSDSARLLVTGCRESEKKKEFLREMD